MKPACVLLAGGRATRMGGGDKCLHKVGDRTILEHVIGRVAPQVSSIALSANGDAARFAAFGLPVLPDPIDGFVGPLAGVLAGMRWAGAQGAALLLSVPSDTPFLPRDLAAGMIEAVDEEGAEIAVAVSDGRPHPTASLWPTNLADDLEAALRRDLRRIKEFMQNYRVIEVAFAIEEVDPFFNVNAPEDLVRAEELLRK